MIKDLDIKAMLLLVDENEYLDKAAESLTTKRLSKEATEKAYGIPLSTILSWAHGESKTPKTGTLLTLIGHLEKGHGVKFGPGGENIGDDEKITDFLRMPSEEFAKRLGLTHEIELKAQDIYRNRWLRRGSYYSLGEQFARRLCVKYGGVYRVFIPILSDTSDYEVMICTLRVRYFFQPLIYKKVQDSAPYYVRCKLNMKALPGMPYTSDLDTGKGYVEYVGLITEREDKAYWCFEQLTARNAIREADFIHFVTSTLDSSNEKMSGTVMSATQDKPGRPYAASVYIERAEEVKEEENLDEVYKFMRNEMNNLRSIEDLEVLHKNAYDFFKEQKRRIKASGLGVII